MQIFEEKAKPAARHTPAPWRQNVLLVQDVIGNQIAHCTRWEGGRPCPEIAEANARLIAAAPLYHDRAYHLAMLVLQSNLYATDVDVREQVDHVLAIHRMATSGSERP